MTSSSSMGTQHIAPQQQQQQQQQQQMAQESLHIPGYTGYVRGIHETYGRTPAMAQLDATAPREGTFLHTRAYSPPVPRREPCSMSEAARATHGRPQDTLWPHLQPTARQDAAKPLSSHLALGDGRINPFHTSYSNDFAAPFAGQERLRSPMRDADLAAAKTPLAEIYQSSYNRVGAKRLAHMIATMRDRMTAKMGNANDNAFRMRQLFRAGDAAGTGLIHYEDFRQFSESFGMQLDDDSLLALYCVHDPEGTGYAAYEPIVAAIMDPDYYAMYSPEAVDNTRATADVAADEALVAALKARVRGGAAAARGVLAALDAANTGVLEPRAFEAGCAALGVVLSPKERAWAARVAAARDGRAGVDYAAFCDALMAGE